MRWVISRWSRNINLQQLLLESYRRGSEAEAVMAHALMLTINERLAERGLRSDMVIATRVLRMTREN